MKILKNEFIKIYDVIRKKSFIVHKTDISKAATKALQDFQDDYYTDQRWEKAYPGTPANEEETPYRYLVLKRGMNKWAHSYGIRPSELGIHTDSFGYCDHWEKRVFFMVSPRQVKKILEVL